MDKFGIGAAVMGAVMTYFRSARQTGRTTALLESLKNGDCVCFVEEKQANIFKRLSKELGVEIECIVVNPRNPEDVFNRATSKGRLIFDHVWLEEFYSGQIKTAMERIDYVERQASGFGMAHIETRLKASELMKWRV